MSWVLFGFGFATGVVVGIGVAVFVALRAYRLQSGNTGIRVAEKPMGARRPRGTV